MLSAYTEVPEATQTAAAPRRAAAQPSPAGAPAPRRAPPARAEAQPQAEAREAVASVARATGAQPGDGVLQVVQGCRRVGRAAYKLQRNASATVRGIVKTPYAATDSLDTLERLKLSEGVDYLVLYDRSALARPSQLDVTSRLVSLGEQARVVHLAPTKLLVVDEEVALLPLTTTEQSVDSAVVVRSSAMLAGVMRIFDDLWRCAAPFSSAPDPVADGARPSEEERRVLSLLASGATDDTIGRLLGFSARTAHRRVRELIVRLGVETRFQAGVQAAKLGWL